MQIKEDKNEVSKNSERKGKPINQKKKKKRWKQRHGVKGGQREKGKLT